MMKKVEKAGVKGIQRKRKPYKVSPEHFFKDGETARILFSKIIGSSEPNRSVIIPSVSYGMANVVRNLPEKKGDIVVVGEQFPSNIYPWMSSRYKLKIVQPPKSKKRGEGWNNKLLGSIDKDTVAVAVGNVHWADGTWFDLKAIREKTNEVNAALVIDGTQSVGALPINVDELKPDALVCAGYKWLMGPYSIGMAYYGPRFDNGTPVEDNWINRLGSENFGGLVSYQEKYHDGALRYEVGEHSNFVLLPMMNVAFKQILKWTPEGIQSYCQELMKDAIPRIQELGFSIEEENFRRSHLFGIRVPKELEMDHLKKSLKNNRVNVSTRGDAIRISPNVYNSDKDVNRLLRALEEAVV